MSPWLWFNGLKWGPLDPHLIVTFLLVDFNPSKWTCNPCLFWPLPVGNPNMFTLIWSGSELEFCSNVIVPYIKEPSEFSPSITLEINQLL